MTTPLDARTRTSADEGAGAAPLNPPEAEPSREAKAFSDIVAWSAECPAWQRDALRRLCTQDGLTDADVEHLTRLCKGETDDGVPLAADQIRNPAAATATVVLRSIRDVHHVNALADSAQLTFVKVGLTVIYGDNGSGKSGYARILKRVCRARSPKGDGILPNIYATATGKPTAQIEYSVNGHNRNVTWTEGQTADPLLSSVSVFDNRTANVHVDETNDVAYTPLPMKVLEQLVEACQEVGKRIKEELKELEKQTPEALRNPQCKSHTTVGKLIADLNGSTSLADIDKLAALTPAEVARLDALRSDLNNDPEKAARQLQGVKSRFDTIVQSLGRLHAAVSDENVSILRGLHARHQAAMKAATAAAGQLFSDQPLPEIGSETWLALWNAARAYSQEAAYPGLPFPVTGDDARCVLCQQSLGPEAAARMVRFEEFIQAETKRQEEQAKSDYDHALASFGGANLSLAELRSLVGLIRDDLGDADLASQVRRCSITSKLRHRAITRGHSGPDAMNLPPAEALLSLPLAERATALDQRIKALRADGESEERKKLREECDELADRAWLAIVKDDVAAEAARRQQAASLQNALKATATKRITDKSTVIAEELVTNSLRAQFSKEVDRLGVAGLAIELRKERSSYGVPLFRVSLVRKPDARVGEVLSEGEHRCVALAAFLAELATSEGNSALVFDDPVSSLDHMHREEVAARLAELAEHRQVVIFTHDIAFLFLLDQACREHGSQIAFRSVTRTDERTGFCQQDPPARAQPVERVIESMQKQLDNEKARYEAGEHEAWDRTLDSLAKRLRETWERAVEEALAPVVRRLSNKVETKGLSKITAVTLEDCRVMREAYGRCSNLLHSESEAINSPRPKPDTVQAELNALRNWVVSIKQRQDGIAPIQ